MQALTKSPTERPTAAQLHRQLSTPDAATTQAAVPTTTPTTAPLPGEIVRPEPSARRRYRGWAVAAAIALVIVSAATITAIALKRYDGSKPRARANPPTTAIPAESTPQHPPPRLLGHNPPHRQLPAQPTSPPRWNGPSRWTIRARIQAHRRAGHPLRRCKRYPDSGCWPTITKRRRDRPTHLLLA